MNQRPTRAPAPPAAQTQQAEHEDATFTEVERPNNLPARAEPTRRTEEANLPTAKSYSERADEVEEALPATGPGAVIASIAAIMAELKPVEKSGWTDFHKYWHVRMQDLSRELTPLMGKHGIVVFQTEEGRELFDNGAVVAVRYRFTVVHKSGAIWPQRPLQTGVSAARNRGGFDDKALNKCHTSARKYFLLSLFQIASEDDADAVLGPSGDAPTQRARPQGNAAPRRAPSPDGKVKSHLLPVVDGEAPVKWATRFGEFVQKAASVAEIDDWYNVNAIVFDKLKTADTQVYNDAIDFMDACTAKLTAAVKVEKPADPISSGNGKTNGKAAENAETPDDQLWLDSLNNAFGACEDAASLSSEQSRLMIGMKAKVAGTAWNKAVDIVRDHLERIQGG